MHSVDKVTTEHDKNLIVSDMKCEFCRKVFQNNKGLSEHITAKHGKFEVSSRTIDKEINKESNIDQNINDSLHTSISSDATVAMRSDHRHNDSIYQELIYCNICGWKFDSLDALSNHMKGWQPVSKTKRLSCINCEKAFSEDRALRQHMNYCTAK